MSTIPPTPYWQSLSGCNKELYRQITEQLLDKATEFEILTGKSHFSDLYPVMNCIHRDHPELFWVNWWGGIRFAQNPLSRRCQVHVSLLLEPKMIDACNRSMNKKLQKLSVSFPRNRSLQVKYHYVLSACIDGLAYKDTGSAVYDHTIIGPLLSHSAVCEGVSKQFLLYCQFLNLPCMIVCGWLDGVPHAWNIIEIQGDIRHIDITAEIGRMGKYSSPQSLLHYSSIQQSKRGYTWNNCPLIRSSV